MAWSYDPTDLDTTTASGRLNTVRLLVGDTDELDSIKVRPLVQQWAF